ncbi:hypothetical protein CSW59_16665 [Caulobacter sp. BP25]|nr:hypothetical protein CSW59_16665 [Caulobacter sp. BP25]
MREKVSLKATDEGSRERKPSRQAERPVVADRFFTPSPDPLRGPPSPARGEGLTFITAAPLFQTTAAHRRPRRR